MVQNSGKYIPITVDWSVPLQHEKNTLYGKWCRFRLNRGLLLYYERTFTKQIDKQLKIRKKFPRSEWEKYFSVSDITKIEKLLKEIHPFPNHHYIPEDLLLYVLYDEEEDYTEEMSRSIEEIYGIKYYSDDIYFMAKKNITLEVFSREIVRMSKDWQNYALKKVYFQ